MTIEEFRNIKAKMAVLIEELERMDYSGISSEDRIKEEDRVIGNLSTLQTILLSNDLSQIPFEEWKGIYLIAEKDLDLSKTHANIDIGILGLIVYETINLKGCNVRGVDKLDSYSEESFDESFIALHPEYFISKDFPDHIREKFYNLDLDFSDIKEYPELLKYVHKGSFRNNSGYSNKFIETIGFDNALRMYREYPEFVEYITSSDNFCMYRNLKYNSSIGYEEAKHIIYAKAVEQLAENAFIKFPPIEILPEDLKKMYPEIIIDFDSLTPEVANAYRSGNLTLKQVRENQNVLRGKNIYIGMRNSEELFFLHNTTRIFGNIWEYIDNVPSELDDIIFKSLSIVPIRFKDKILGENAKLVVEEIPEFIAQTITNVQKKGLTIQRIKECSYYVSLNEILEPDLFDFISDWGIENLIRYNKQNSFVLDTKFGLQPILLEIIAKAASYFNTPQNLDNPDKFSDYISKLFYRARRTQTYYNRELNSLIASNREILSRIFPNDVFSKEEIFFASNLVDSIDKKNIESEMMQALDGDIDKLLTFLKKYPNLVELFKTKKIAFPLDDNKQSSISSLYYKIGNERFFDICLKYNDSIRFLLYDSYIPLEDKIMLVEEISENENYEEVLNKHIYSAVIKYRKIDIRNLPDSFKRNYSQLLLPESSDKELKEAYYTGKIDSHYILTNPQYRNDLYSVDLQMLYKYMPITVNNENGGEENNLVTVLEEKFGKQFAFDVMMYYGIYIEKAYAHQILNVSVNSDTTQEDILAQFDECVYQTILKTDISYGELLPQSFKDAHPDMFLPVDTPQDIKEKFYGRKIMLEDLTNIEETLDYFKSTNIAWGFNKRLVWLANTFSESSFDIANYKRVKIAGEYEKIDDERLQEFFVETITQTEEDINIDRIEHLVEILCRISKTNSTEMYNFRREIATSLLKVESPFTALEKIEEIFIENNTPTVGKIYSVFEILHPEFIGFDFSERSKISPVLKKASTRTKNIIIFADLIKASFGSNNRTVRDYIENLEQGEKIYNDILSGKTDYAHLTIESKSTIDIFCKHLITLYNKTKKGKINESIQFKENTVENITKLKELLSPDGTIEYSLSDRAVSMFCHFAGIDTIDEAKLFCTSKIRKAEIRNREAAAHDMKLEEGDYIKGIVNIKYLPTILQNGSVAREFLGASAGSDATPLDTDLSIILSSEGTVSETMKKTVANGYGPVWFVLKGDDRFIITRDHDGNKYDASITSSKLEVFCTGGCDHYGIRTGFASSDIDYILVENYDEKIGLEIAINGFYIPVANKEGKIVFTPEDYDNLRGKMGGLKYYGVSEYEFSENLESEDIIAIAAQLDESAEQTRYKSNKIKTVVEEVLVELSEELGEEITLKTEIDGDLSEGRVELIDTGSTGRGTNKPGDGDFDFMMRLDRTFIENSQKLNRLKQLLLQKFGKEDARSEVTGNGDFRLKDVILDDVEVDIDISFTPKTDKIRYSTDQALKDRLETIRRQDPEKHKLIVANILLAKRILKEAEAYKPNRGENPQGGLGGVGIENWILQHGGSFEDAANSFLKASEGKTFEQFKESYQIWDFGENHMAVRNGEYAHDNFVCHNMSEEGWKRTIDALTSYFKEKEVSTMLEENTIREDNINTNNNTNGNVSNK